MFVNRSSLIQNNSAELYYGVAIVDVDDDGAFEWFVAGYGFPNRVLKWDAGCLIDIANPVLADGNRQAIGVAAGDLDGDGREEIYVLNTDSFSGRKRMGDRLFVYGFDGWADLFSSPNNRKTLNLTAGRSVIAIDRFGSGRYGFFVANYGGPMRLYELDDDGRLADVAADCGVALTTGGRGAIALPLVSAQMDIFAVNELGSNFLFRNRGDGTFEEVAREFGLADPHENGRGIAALDANDNGLFGLVYGNWEGHHRLYVQEAAGIFRDVAPPDLAKPSRVRTVIAADFDNDGYEEVFFNNIGQPNRLFGRRDGIWQALDMGEAVEPDGLGTGAAVGDLDGDGRLELLVAHGESGRQMLSLYHTPENGNNWLRVLPRTPAGAPARGAVVVLKAGRTQRRVIDAGSGYLCQMEPVAHFGLGTETAVEYIEVQWPDGMTAQVDNPSVNQLLPIDYPT